MEGSSFSWNFFANSIFNYIYVNETNTFSSYIFLIFLGLLGNCCHLVLFLFYWHYKLAILLINGKLSILIYIDYMRESILQNTEAAYSTSSNKILHKRSLGLCIIYTVLTLHKRLSVSPKRLSFCL